MDIWLSAYNTTTQGLNGFLSQSTPSDDQRAFLVERFTRLIGSVKLFMCLDQRFGFTDNHIIDSGLIRGLFRYNNDSAISRLKDELKDTLFSAANNIIYVYDTRIRGDNLSPETLLKKRFELTTKGFLHSAAFGDEANWNGIETYNDLINHIPEYKFISGFLIELLERIPKENIIKNPQEPDLYGNMIENRFEIESDKFQESPRLALRSYLKDNPEPIKRNRTNLYNHLESRLDSGTAEGAKKLFADQLYNRQAIEALKPYNYTFEEWNIIDGSQEMFNKVYKPTKNEEPKDKLQVAVQRLHEKGKMLNFLAFQNKDTILQIQKDMRNVLMDESIKDKKKFAREIMWCLYNSKHGDDVNKSLSSAGLDTLFSALNILSPIKNISLPVPVLKSIHEHQKTFKFFYLTNSNSDYRSDYRNLIDIFEYALSKDS